MIRGARWTAAQTRVRGSCLPSTACGRRVGGEGLVFSRFRKFQSGFVRLPAPESLFSCVAKRKVTQREGHPDAALSGRPALRVREARPGFSTGLLPGRKGIALLGDARCAALSSTPHRRIGAPEKQRAPSAQKQQPKPRVSRIVASVSRCGAVWPYRLSHRRELFQTTSTFPVCNSGVLNQAVSLGYFS